MEDDKKRYIERQKARLDLEVKHLVEVSEVPITYCPARFAGGFGDIEELRANVDFYKCNKHKRSGFIKDEK